MSQRIKILWICDFSNEKVQGKLGSRTRRIGNLHPWISKTIPLFENNESAELHIVAPHEYIACVKDFVLDGVKYYFFNPYIPIWGRHWPWFLKLDAWTSYAKNKLLVRRIVDSIKPDVIHLQGAENPKYSSTIFQFFGRYPVIVNLQRINLPFLETLNQKAVIEKSILCSALNFSIRTKTMERDIRSYRPDARVFWVNYAMKEYKPIECQKEYDIVYFARVCREKGIEDLIKALGIVHDKMPNTRLCVIGGVSHKYKEFLQLTAKDLHVNGSITWKGYLLRLEDVHIEASKAKISVLPTHNDIIPGTIIESMQLGLPVVSYKAGSIPELNEERENVLLSDIGDIEGVADNILRLLTDEELYKTMSQRGIECIRERYSNQNVLQQHLDCYREVIADFQNSKIKKQVTESSLRNGYTD